MFNSAELSLKFQLFVSMQQRNWLHNWNRLEYNGVFRTWIRGSIAEIIMHYGERAREYRERARECMRQAELAGPEDRDMLLERAAYFLRLAERWDRWLEDGEAPPAHDT